MAQLILPASSSSTTPTNLAEALANVDARIDAWTSSSAGAGEIGHAIDIHLNGSNESPGDEGEIVSALLQDQKVTLVILSQSGQHTLNLGGLVVAIEAGDSSTPVALTTNPAYAAPTINPFGLTGVGYEASPSLVDIDGDGDLDAFIGNGSGSTFFFRNTATAGSITPAYAAAATNPFGLANVDDRIAKISFAEIDGDGDLDVFIGTTYGNTLFYRNTAAPGSTSPAYIAPTTNPFGLGDVGSNASPSFADIDGDGDLDAFISNGYGNTLFFRNTAAAGITNPAYAAATTNPFGMADVGWLASPSFVDIDGDGDLDAFIGNRDGNTLFFRNTAAAGSTSPAYAAATTNAFGLMPDGYRASPSFVDIDADGDLDAFIGDGFGITHFFRNTAPAFGLSSTTSNGSYGVGAVIDLTLTFSEPVLVTGIPQLQLETGSTDRYAIYSSGSGSSTLTFSYTVQARDSAADLDLFSANALSLNGGTIKDAAGNNALLNLAAPGSPASLAARKNLVIEARAFVTGVTSTTANGVYGVGAVINLTVTYSQAVFVTGTPQLLLETGSTDRFATYSSGSGTSTLTFSYTVQPGDNAADLDILSSSALSLHGGTIKDAAGNSASLALPAPGAPGSLGANKNLVIEAMALVTGVTSPTANGTYSVGAVINLTVTYSQAVLVTATPQLLLETGSIDRFAVYTGGSGTSTLTFSYTVQPGDNAADLDILSSSALSLNGGTIKDAAGNNASLALPAPGAPGSLGANKNLVIEAMALVTGVTSPTANGTYSGGAVINLTVTYSQAVLVTGTPQLQLETGSIDRFAIYTGGSGTSTLTFSYTVQAGDSSADLDLINTNALSLNGGTIKDMAFGGNASLSLAAPGAHGSLGANKNLLIDTTPPVALTTTPAYAAGATTPFGLGDVGYIASPNFVDIDGDGDLDSFIGEEYGTTRFFRNTAAAGSSNPAYTAATNPFGLAAVDSYASPELVDIDGDGDLDAFIGNGYGNTLFFRNTADAGSFSPAYAAAATNPFGLTAVRGVRFASPNFVDIDGDGDLDALIGNVYGNTRFFRNTAAAGSINPAYAAATTNPFGLADVGYLASPAFADIDADGDLDAFIGEEFGNTLFFRNTAAAGSTSPAYAAATTNPFGLTDVGYQASPAIADIDGDGDLDAFIGNGGGSTLFFRNTAPALGVSSTTANGSYGVGAVINLTLTFSEPVLVTGIPQLQLETGTTDRYAVYTGGSGSSTLTFTYTVQVGDRSADLDLLSANALSLNGGNIKDAAGNNAVLSLAAPGSPASLAARKNLVIKNYATPPVITAGPTVIGVSGISVTSNESGSAALYKADNSQLFPTALTANTPATLTLAAQAVVTTATLKVADAAGNLTAAAPGFRLGTKGSEGITGSAGADFVYGFSGNDNLTGGGGNDTLIGSDGYDSYLFDSDSALGSDTLNEAGGGSDTLNFSATTSRSIGLNLGLASSQVVNSNLSLTLGSGATFENVIGGSLADAITGNSLNNRFTGGGGNDTLIGGAGYDSYLFDADAALGSDTLNEAGGGGDTLDFSATTTRSIALNLGLASSQVINANLSLTLGSGATFENVIGGSLADAITGNSLNNRLTGGLGKDTLTGGGATQSDTFVYTTLNESLLSGYDVITDYTGCDRLIAPFSVETTTLDTSAGNVQSLTGAAISALLTPAAFAANTAAAFTATGQVGTFVALNDGRAGFQADTDSIISLRSFAFSSTNYVDLI